MDVDNGSDMDKLYLYVQSFFKTRNSFEKCIAFLQKKWSKDDTILDASYFIEQIHNINRECLERSIKIKKLFKKYQLTAIQYITTHRGLICAFDVGTGKTLTAVGACFTMDKITKLFHIKVTFLIVTPTSLQHNFKKEMESFGMDSASSNFVFYTTAKFAIEYKKGNIHYENMILIIDEAHVFRTDYRFIFSDFPVENSKENTRAECAVECASFASKVLLLTATPIYNRTHDIVNLVSMVRGVYPPFEQKPEELSSSEFKKIYGKSILFQKADTSLFDEKGNRIYPERKDILVKVIMTPRYLKKYESLEEEIKQKKQKDDKSNAFNVLMRQAANDMDESIKLEPVMEIILKNKKTILYSEFLSKGLLIVQDELKKKNIPFFSISGETTMAQRKKIVEKMNMEGEGGCNLILVTKAGGEGLDFKGIRKVIIFEKGWNVSVEEQVIGRAIRHKSHIHLPPNKQNVKVYTILALKPYYIHFEACLKNMIKEEDITIPSTSIIKNEELLDHERRIMPEHGKIESIGVDLNMYVQALVKEKENIELRKKLEKEQISIMDIFSKEECPKGMEGFAESSIKKLPLARFILLPFPEKGFHKKTKKIEIFESFHTLTKKYINTIDMILGTWMDGMEIEEDISVCEELLEYLPVDTSIDKYLLTILRKKENILQIAQERNEMVRLEHIFSKYLSPSYTKYKLYFLMMGPLQLFLVCDRSQPKRIFCTPFFISPDYFIERIYTHSCWKIEEEIFLSFLAEMETFARKTLKAEDVIILQHPPKKEHWGVDFVLEMAGYSHVENIDCGFFEKEEYVFFHL
jgi:superfamily II DNA or RNA helicase